MKLHLRATGSPSQYKLQGVTLWMGSHVLLYACETWPRTRCRWTTSGGFPHEVPTPSNQDPLARSHQELRGRSAHRSRSGVGSHQTPPELRLRSHCQAFWRHASPPSTPVSCRSDSRPSPWPKLEASPRSSQQPMDWPATQGQQQHATSWPVEKMHRTWSYRSDATVLDDYALTTTTANRFAFIWRTICQISSWSDLRRRSLRLFWRASSQLEQQQEEQEDKQQYGISFWSNALALKIRDCRELLDRRR